MGENWTEFCFISQYYLWNSRRSYKNVVMRHDVSLIFNAKRRPYKWKVCRRSDEFLMYKSTFRTPPHITQLILKQKHISRMQLSTEHLLIHRTGSTSCSVAFCMLVLSVWCCACLQKCITAMESVVYERQMFLKVFSNLLSLHCLHCFKTESKWLWNGSVKQYVYSLFLLLLLLL